jgi:hypothetical protein
MKNMVALKHLLGFDSQSCMVLGTSDKHLSASFRATNA